MSTDPKSVLFPVRKTLLGLALGAAALGMSLAGCDRQSAPPATENQGETAPAEIACEIRFHGRAADTSGRVLVPADATVFEALRLFAEERNLPVEHRGSGETLFVVAIGDVANEGAGGDNWVYLINDQLGDRSSGARKLSPGDRLVWRFGSYP